MNSYRCSDGSKITKSEIDKRIRKAKEIKLNNFINEYGYYFCEDCERSDIERLDCSHTISVDKCQKEGKSELSWDIDNIKLRCRKCHNSLDNTYIHS